MAMTSLEQDIRQLFMQNLSLFEMQAVLCLEKNIQMSLRTLKRKLHKLGLKRRKALDMRIVEAALKVEMEGSGQRLGCRMMVQRLLNIHGISVGRDRVLQQMHVLDGEGVQMRRRHCLTRRQYYNSGPNFLIHIDGYDKLKNYGLAIHGAICGFSRKMLWLKVNRTNNDPDIVASYFIDFVEQISGTPNCIRTDAGTENVTIISMQKAMRWFHKDSQCGEKSVIIGSSHSNQRIEAWWRQLRQLCVGYWIDFFKDADHQGLLLTAHPLHMECLRFCYTKLVQHDLDRVKTEWNCHRVRPSRESIQYGKPDLLYYHPELFGLEDQKKYVEPSDIQSLKSYVTRPPKFGCLDEHLVQFQDLMRVNQKDMPTSSTEALDLYQWLIQIVSNAD